MLRTSIFLSLLALGCSAQTTKVEKISAVPKAVREYKRILVFAVTENTDIRMEVESALGTSLNQQAFLAKGYERFNQDLPWNDPTSLQSQVVEEALAGEFDGILVSSLVRKQTESVHVPGQISQQPIPVSMGSTASSMHMQTTVSPDYYKTAVNYVVKSTLFDTQSEQAVWQMYSTTVNPESIGSAVAEFGKVLADALKKTVPHQTQKK